MQFILTLQSPAIVWHRWETWDLFDRAILGADDVSGVRMDHGPRLGPRSGVGVARKLRLAHS